MEDAYKVRLEIFEGPLDLLLYLVKKDEVEINEVSLERITRQYLDYMDAFKLLNVDLASEFVVMAANLMYIKSRTLLPKQDQPPEEDAEEDDPRWELIRQLIEYKKFKDAAGFLEHRARLAANIFPAQPEPISPPPDPAPVGMPEVGIFDLIRAFQKVLDKVRVPDLREIADDRYTVSDKIDYLLELMPRQQGPVRFSSLFANATSRDEIIVTFIAVLELMKLRHIRVTQDHLLGDIVLFRNEVARAETDAALRELRASELAADQAPGASESPVATAEPTAGDEEPAPEDPAPADPVAPNP
jgi:segregation and condensation protein A